MRPYSTSGSFGEVRFAKTFKKSDTAALDSIIGAGWHRVNDLYRFVQPNGITTLLLLYTVSGHGTVWLDNKKYLLSAHTVFTILPGIPYKYYPEAGKEWEFYWLHIEGSHAVETLKSEMASNMLLQVSVCCIENHFRRIMNYETTYSDSDIFAARIISNILYDMICESRAVFSSENQMNIISDMIEEIESNCINCSKPLHISDFASKYFLSQEYLIRLFRKKTGTTPYHYLHRLKMTKSAQLLVYSDQPVKQISSLLGYSCTASFSIQFKKAYGISPAEYRNQNRVYHN